MFTSSLGKKYLMGLTGFFLIFFLIVHSSINALIFYDDQGATFNAAAHFMVQNFFVRFLEIGLFVVFILHSIQGILLWQQNKKARKIKYHVKKYPSEIKWASRYMGWLGTLILLFLIMHLWHFWSGSKNQLYFNGPELDLYQQMKFIFTNPIWFSLYMIGLASLLFHLLHGFQSAFQTFGMNNRRLISIVKGIGIAYSFVIVLLFASMPIAFMIGWLQ